MDYRPKDSKYKPPEVEERDSNVNGSQGAIQDFNKQGKVTNVSGSDYNDFRKNSGLYGNFAEKDASMDYLRGRNKEGQRIKNYSGTNELSELRTGGGVTAYDARPIPEVYHPATSQGPISPNAVVYNTTDKNRQPVQPYTQDTESDKLTEDQTKHIKSKE